MLHWAYPSPYLNGISIGSAVYAQLTAEGSYILQWAATSPIKIAHSHGVRSTAMRPNNRPTSETMFLFQRLSLYVALHKVNVVAFVSI